MEKIHLRTRLCPPLTSLGSGAGAWSRVWSPWLQAPHGAHVSVTEPMTSRTEKCWVKAGGQSDCRSDKQHRCPEAQTCESGPRRAAGPTDSCPAPVAPAPPALRGGPAPCSLPQAHVPVPSLQEEPPALCGRSRQGFCGAQGPGPGLSLVRGIWGPSWEERLSGLRLAHVAGAGGRPAKLCIRAGVAAAWPGQDCRPEPPPVSPPRARAPPSATPPAPGVAGNQEGSRGISAGPSPAHSEVSRRGFSLLRWRKQSPRPDARGGDAASSRGGARGGSGRIGSGPR